MSESVTGRKGFFPAAAACPGSWPDFDFGSLSFAGAFFRRDNSCSMTAGSVGERRGGMRNGDSSLLPESALPDPLLAVPAESFDRDCFVEPEPRSGLKWSGDRIGGNAEVGPLPSSGDRSRDRSRSRFVLFLCPLVFGTDGEVGE